MGALSPIWLWWRKFPFSAGPAPPGMAQGRGHSGCQVSWLPGGPALLKASSGISDYRAPLEFLFREPHICTRCCLHLHDGISLCTHNLVGACSHPPSVLCPTGSPRAQDPGPEGVYNEITQPVTHSGYLYRATAPPKLPGARKSKEGECGQRGRAGRGCPAQCH